MAKSRVDSSGAFEKLNAMLSIRELASNFVVDTASYFKQKLNGSILNGTYVGYRSTNLIRSQSFRRLSPYKVEFFSDSNLAPYAGTVSRRLASSGGFKNKKRSGGRGFYQILVDQESGQVRKVFSKLEKEYIRSVNSKKPYKYVNRYPA